MVVDREMQNITKELTNIRRTFETLNRTCKEGVRILAQNSAVKANIPVVDPDVIAEVPVHIDWTSTGLNGTARLMDTDDGFVIEMSFGPGVLSEIKRLLPHMELEQLNVSAVNIERN